jgi:hypothetical protein
LYICISHDTDFYSVGFKMPSKTPYVNLDERFRVVKSQSKGSATTSSRNFDNTSLYPTTTTTTTRADRRTSTNTTCCSQKFKAWSTLIASTIYMMYPGSIYIQGAITPYIASYYNVHATKVANMLPSFFVLGALVMPVGGWLISKGIGAKTIISIGSIIQLITFFIAIHYCTDSFIWFFAFYISGYGVLQGLTYMVPIKQSWLHFPNNPGFVSGIILGGYGFSTFVLDNTVTAIINPSNLKTVHGKFPQEVDDRFQLMMYSLGACYAFMALIGIVFIFPGPTKYRRSSQHALLEKGGGGGPTIVVRSSPRHSIPPPTTTNSKDSMFKILTSRQCILIYIMNFCSVTLGFYVVNEFKAYGNINGLNDDKYLSFVGSMAAIMNSCRFVWSGLLDKFTYKTVYGALLVIQIGISLTMHMIRQNQILYCIWVSTALFCLGAHFSLVPNQLKKVFGVKRAIQMYSIVFSYAAVACCVQIGLQVMFLDEHHLEVFDYFFFLDAALSMFALVLLFLFFEEGRYHR